MQKFKIVVSKQGKNFTFVLSAENEILAKEKVHKEGYSVINIEEISDVSNFGVEFLFEAEKNGNTKSGKIIGTDIFKAYVKLRKNLGYNVLNLYKSDNLNITSIEKKEIIKELEEEYNIFTNNFNKKQKKDIEEKKEVKKNIKDSNYDNENFYLKKNLEETHKLIDFILEKLKNIIDGKEIEDLSIEEKEKLKNIYNGIIKIKSTTNILKLKEIGEKALLKVGLLELKFVEKQKSRKSKKLLSDTNKLLKKIGSSKSILEKKYDISYYITKIKEYINNKTNKPGVNLNNFLDNNKKNKKVDKESYYFIKNQLILNKYQDKLKNNRKLLFKNLFNSKKRKDSLLKQKVIKQNIIILQAKIKGIGFSYTFLKKGYKNIFSGILRLLKNIRTILLYIIILYTIFFILFLNFNYYFNIQYFNFDGIKYVLLSIILYYILYLSKNLFNIFISGALYYIIIILLLINF